MNGRGNSNGIAGGVTGGRVLFVWRSYAIVGLRWVLLAVLIALALAKAGAPWPVAELALVAVGLLLAFSAVLPCRNRALERLRVGVFVLALGITAYVLAQSFTVPSGSLANPIWDVLHETLPGAGGNGTISVSPEQSLWTLPRLLLPFALFIFCLPVLAEENQVQALWKAIAIFGAVFSLYGIAQTLLFPDWLLVGEKRYYRDSLTGPFVNRNNAATFIGLYLLATLALLRQAVSKRRRDERRAEAPCRSGLAPRLTAAELLLLSAALVDLVALVMTKSRGGLISTALALVVMLYLLDFRFLKRNLEPRFGRRNSRIIVLVASLVFAVFALELFAGRVLYRLEVGGGDVTRLCAYASTWAAALTNLPFGTGLGTFMDVFPAYRDPSCGIFGIWDFAHNSYLEGFLELGLFYPLALVVGLFVVLRALTIGLRERKRFRPLVAAGLAATVLVATHALADFSLQIPAVSALYAIILAGAISVSLGRRR